MNLHLCSEMEVLREVGCQLHDPATSVPSEAFLATGAVGGAGVPEPILRFLRDGVAAESGCMLKLKASKELQDDQPTERQLTPPSPGTRRALVLSGMKKSGASHWADTPRLGSRRKAAAPPGAGHGGRVARNRPARIRVSKATPTRRLRRPWRLS
jgi:hypothetical protein